LKTPATYTTYSFVTLGRSSRHAAWLVVLLVMVALGLGGCGGGREERLTQNNSLPVRCLDEPDPGPCRAFVTRYFYDYRHDRCRAFRYGGYQGRVPFETLAACEKTCFGGEP